MTLPEDIVAFDILPWLPAKSIYKFKSISKSFSKVSEDPNFVTKQVENSFTKDDTCIFIQPDTDKYVISRVVELHPLPRNKSSSGISSDFLKSLSDSARVLSSSNGLIIYRTNENPTKLFIWNPVTKSESLIPNPTLIPDPINRADAYFNDDLIILLECYHNDVEYSLLQPWYRCRCNVYNSKEGVWKTTIGGFVMGGRDYVKFDYDYMPVFLYGLFYIISGGYLMTYNLENGETKMLKLPKGSGVWSTRIFKWGKVPSSTRSICLANYR